MWRRKRDHRRQCSGGSADPASTFRCRCCCIRPHRDRPVQDRPSHAGARLWFHRLPTRAAMRFWGNFARSSRRSREPSASCPRNGTHDWRQRPEHNRCPPCGARFRFLPCHTRCPPQQKRRVPLRRSHARSSCTRFAVSSRNTHHPAHAPDDVCFATKPQSACRMIVHAIAAKVPFSFVAADSVYGTGEIETALRKAGNGYVLGVAANHVFHSWGKQKMVSGSAAKIAQNFSKSAWRRLSAGDGTKGERLHDWAYLELADLDAGEYNRTFTGKWTRGLLIRRNIADDDLAFFSTWCPKDTPMKKLVSVEGHRWAIEDSFETAKNELGLDHNETRSWHGWHRHVSLVMLAFAMMAVIRHRANITSPPKKMMLRLRTKQRS